MEQIKLTKKNPLFELEFANWKITFTWHDENYAYMKAVSLVSGRNIVEQIPLHKNSKVPYSFYHKKGLENAKITPYQVNNIGILCSDRLISECEERFYNPYAKEHAYMFDSVFISTFCKGREIQEKCFEFVDDGKIEDDRPF